MNIKWIVGIAQLILGGFQVLFGECWVDCGSCWVVVVDCCWVGYQWESWCRVLFGD